MPARRCAAPRRVADEGFRATFTILTRRRSGGPSSMDKTPLFPLAACAEMLFRGLPMPERVRRIAGMGFMVEIWDWTKHDIDALARTGAEFSSMTGYVRGTLADDEGADELVRTAG